MKDHISRVLFCFFRDKVLLSYPGWPLTHNPPASARITECATMPAYKLSFASSYFRDTLLQSTLKSAGLWSQN